MKIEYTYIFRFSITQLPPIVKSTDSGGGIGYVPPFIA